MARYHARCVSPYPAERMFDLVADVESYPAFVPWWIDSKIIGQEDGLYQTIQTMGLGPVRLRFMSRTAMERPNRIHVSAKGGGLKNLELFWGFEELEQGCRVSLSMDLQMASPALDLVVSRLSRDAAKTMVDAFCRRAHAVYRENPGLSTPRVRP